MKALKYFSLKEWLALKPLTALYKERRNDVVQALYEKKTAKGLDDFLLRCAEYEGKSIAIVIAFEQPWALNWLLVMAKKNLEDTHILVFDNSRDAAKRSEILAVCQKNSTPYLSLPYNGSRHPARSHGRAMTWVYRHVVTKIKPKYFAFLDHDLIPIKPISLAKKLEESGQFCYGTPNKAKGMPYWHLWAGYCVFVYDEVKDKPLNFSYDFSRGLDTGGRNWPVLYQSLEFNAQKFACDKEVLLRLSDDKKEEFVQVIDDAWFHIGGISYNNNFQKKEAIVRAIESELSAGLQWDDIIKT